MGIRNLKKENNNFNLTLIDMLSKFDPSKTKKYTQFLIKILSNRLTEQLNYTRDSDVVSVVDFERREIEKLVPFDSYENTITRMIVCDFLFSWEQMDQFVDFCNLMERGLITEKDISKYDCWEMMERELFEAKNKDSIKKAEKEIQVILNNERYLIFKPLTYLASKTYGYQTKWCTAMNCEPSYFYSHSKGILIYLIDRETNKRFGFHKRMLEFYELGGHEFLVFATWDEQGRQIDTFQTELPHEILKIVADEFDLSNPKNIPNYKHFSENELKIMTSYVEFPESHLYTYMTKMVNSEPIEQPTLRLLRRRLGIGVPVPELDDTPIRNESYPAQPEPTQY